MWKDGLNEKMSHQVTRYANMDTYNDIVEDIIDGNFLQVNFVSR